MNTELKLLVEAIILFRNRRKLGQQTEEEYQLECDIAEYLTTTGNYQLYLDISNGTKNYND